MKNLAVCIKNFKNVYSFQPINFTQSIYPKEIIRNVDKNLYKIFIMALKIINTECYKKLLMTKLYVKKDDLNLINFLHRDTGRKYIKLLIVITSGILGDFCFYL